MVTRAWWVGCAALAAILLGGLPARAGVFSEQAKKLIEERSYVSFYGVSAGINRSGDFDGWGVVNGTDYTLIPSIKRNVGIGVSTGYRSGEYAAEVSYWHSQHVAQWTDGVNNFESHATYHAVNIDLKRYLFPRLKAQPFLVAGLAFPWMVVRDGTSSNPPDPTKVGDSTLSGMGFNAGLGMELYLNQKFSVFLSGVQRWTSYNHVKGYSHTVEDTAGNLKGDGLNWLAGMAVNFM